MFVYLVCVDTGAYMEPYIEILKIFKHKNDALLYITNFKSTFFNYHHKPFILKRKVYL